MKINFDCYFLSDDKKLMSVDKIHSFLSKSYWASDRPKEIIEKSIEKSYCIGIYKNDEMIGFARIVTDWATIYWVCDVFIDEKERKKGLGKQLIKVITEHEIFSNLTGILVTGDAHKLYEKYGFVTENNKFMRRVVNKK